MTLDYSSAADACFSNLGSNPRLEVVQGDLYLALNDAVGRIPLIGHYLRYLVPVANYRGVYALSDDQVRSWAVLDTFDMLSPMHDHPQTGKALEDWLRQAGLENLDVRRIGFLVASGQKPELRHDIR